MRTSIVLVLLVGCGRSGFDPIVDGTATLDGATGGGGTLAVVLEGDGMGTVTSNPPGIACPGTCEATFSTTRVTLTATPSGTSLFGGWSQPGCVGATCALDVVDMQTVTARFTGARNIIFVASRTERPGALGGLAGADALCMQLAAQASLQGTYVALLSTSTVTAQARLGAARGWVRPDGLPVADTAADLVGGRHFYPPNLDETGWRASDSTRATTGTTAAGVAGETCADYTDTAVVANPFGSLVHGGSTNFIASTVTSCNIPATFYCAGTSYNAPVAPVPQTGAFAFATLFTVSATAGLSGADAACNSAAAGKLPGTYVALLATTTSSAASRITNRSVGFVRPDGVPVARNFDAFITGTLLAPIAIDANGDTASNGVLSDETWGGATNIESVGTSTCGDWLGGASGSTGAIRADSTFFYDNGGRSCGQALYIYCLQQ